MVLSRSCGAPGSTNGCACYSCCNPKIVVSPALAGTQLPRGAGCANWIAEGGGHGTQRSSDRPAKKLPNRGRWTLRPCAGSILLFSPANSWRSWASGSGKSTLLHILGGLDDSSEGEVSLAGHRLAQMEDKELTLQRRRPVGVVFWCR